MSEFEKHQDTVESRREYFLNIFEYAATPETGRVFLTRTAADVLESVIPYGFNPEQEYDLMELYGIVGALHATGELGEAERALKRKMDTKVLLEDLFLGRISVSAAGERQGVLRATAFQRLRRITAHSHTVVASKSPYATVEDLLSHAPEVLY